MQVVEPGWLNEKATARAICDVKNKKDQINWSAHTLTFPQIQP